MRSISLRWLAFQVVISLFLLLPGRAGCWDCPEPPPEGYYDNAAGLLGEELRQALRDIISGHTAIPYGDNWELLYGLIDCQDGDLRCPYTGRWTTGGNNCSTAQAWGNGFNCEHTWPQGFFSQNEPMRGDFHHLFAVDGNANNRRGNYPFGSVTGPPTWQVGGSKLGSDGQRTVFEPRDDDKGDVARAIFYMMTRYRDDQLSTGGIYMDERQMDVLLTWNVQDPVSSRECDRLTAIFGIQHNRNPYLDNADFARLVWLPDATLTPTPPFATPTPTPAEPTATETPDWPSVTPQPTDVPRTPTATRTPTPASSPTPPPTETENTPVPPTSTPAPSPTAPPTVSPTPEPEAVTFTLSLNQLLFQPQDQFLLLSAARNTTRSARALDCYILLDVYADYWFWPSWSQQVDKLNLTLRSGQTRDETVLDFTWPAGAGAADGIVFWGALFDAGTWNLTGEVARIEWGFTE